MSLLPDEYDELEPQENRDSFDYAIITKRVRFLVDSMLAHAAELNGRGDGTLTLEGTPYLMASSGAVHTWQFIVGDADPDRVAEDRDYLMKALDSAYQSAGMVPPGFLH